MHTKIYVPNFASNGEISTYCEGIAKIIAKRYGGATIIPNCRGIWVNAQNEAIYDYIAIIETYYIGDSKEANLQWLKELARKIKIDLNQNCTAFTVNEDIYFV